MEFKQLLWAFRFPALVFFINEFLDSVYIRWAWFDVPMHALGGVVVALSASEVLAVWRREKKFSASPFIECVFIVSFVALVAVAWEWHEYLRMAWLSAPPNSLEDTLADLALGIAGAISVCFLRRAR